MRAVIVVKTKMDIDGVDTAIDQWDQMFSECIRRNVQVVGRIVTTAGFKDVARKVKKQDKTKEFDLLVLYSPHQYTERKQEYIDFVKEMQELFNVKVVAVRSKF